MVTGWEQLAGSTEQVEDVPHKAIATFDSTLVVHVGAFCEGGDSNRNA